MLKICRKNCKGFTLLELLVVVLIIGILAAIALPQYKLAVGKSKFATLKDLTRTIKDSSTRYYMLNNNYPTKAQDLDIGLQLVKSEYKEAGKYLVLTFNEGSCTIFNDGSITCGKNIFSHLMRYYIYPDHRACLVYSIDKKDIGNRICQNETSKKNPNFCNDDADYCHYEY